MGGTQSVEQQIDKRMKNINNLHADVDASFARINSEGDRLVDVITRRNYTNYGELCDKIGYQKVDELRSHFPIQVLEGVRYRLGLTPDPVGEKLVQNKDQICKSIVNFYKKKIHLIEEIKREIPKCKRMEYEIFTDLSKKIKREIINTEKWIDVYKKMQRFNSDIKSRYSQIERALELLRRAQTKPQLDRTAKNIINLLGKTTTMCKRYQNDLLRFSNVELGERITVPTAEQARRIREKPLPIPPSEEQ